MLMYCKRYCSDHRIVGIRRRTTLAAFLIMGQGMGMTASPFFGGLLSKIGFGNSIFNGYTSPGWIMACIWCIFWICVTVWYEDVPQGQKFLPTLLESKSMEKIRQQPSVEDIIEHPAPEPKFTLTLPRIGVIVCMCWLAMTYFFVLGAWESNIPVFGSADRHLHWSPFASGNFIALGGAAAFPFLVLNIYLARRIEDRKMLAFGTSLGVVALFIFLALLETDNVNYGSIFVCWWAVVLGFNTAFTVPVSLLSKQFPPSWNNKTSIMVQCSTFVGRVSGAVLGGSGVRIGMRTYISVEIALAGIGTLLYIVLWRELKTKRG
jgi:MFS family permease